MPTILLTVWSFIKRLNLSQIALVAAIGFALFYRVGLGIERRHAGKLQERVNELRFQLDAISAKRNEQADTTKGTIAKGIESSPIVPGCITPPAIMGSADL